MLLFRYMAIATGLFFFKQKTAYEMRISDWSSDVCSSDLRPPLMPADHDPPFEQQMFAHAVAPHQPERLGVGVGLRTDSDHVSDDRVGQREQTARNPAHAAMTDRRKVEPPELGTLAQHV